METLNPASIFENSTWLMMPPTSSKWTKEDNKKFESALAMVDEKTPDRWFKVASMIPGKSVSEVIDQYKELVADVRNIEAGLIPDPGYLAPSFTFELMENQRFDGFRKRGRSCDQERKKGIPWTEEEHRMNGCDQPFLECLRSQPLPERFLMGLEAHGKGDWRNISRNYVISKTPTQVASHAQKYFLRQISGGKDKKRPSIHDITTVNVLQKLPSDECKSPPSLSISSEQKIKPIRSPKGLFDWKKSNDGLLMAFDSNSDRHNESMGPLFDIAAHNNHYAANLCAANSKFHFPSAKYVHG